MDYDMSITVCATSVHDASRKVEFTVCVVQNFTPFGISVADLEVIAADLECSSGSVRRPPEKLLCVCATHFRSPLST